MFSCLCGGIVELFIIGSCSLPCIGIWIVNFIRAKKKHKCCGHKELEIYEPSK